MSEREHGRPARSLGEAHVASRVEGLMQLETQPEPCPYRALKAREKLRT